MNIIINELKKIFTLKNICILFIGAVLIYSMFIKFWIYTVFEYNANSSYKITMSMKEKYGNYFDENEYKDFKEEYSQLTKQIDEYLYSREDCSKIGMNTYEKFKEKQNPKENNNESELCSEIFWDKEELFLVAQEYEQIIGHYEYLDVVNARKNQLSIFSYDLDFTYKSFIENISILIILSVVFLISPIFIKDKMGYVDSLQLSSNTGRKIYSKKILASLITTSSVVLIELAVLYIMFFKESNSSIFFDSNMNSFLGNPYYIIDITYLQYIIGNTIMLMILAISATLGSIYISSKAKNYVSIITRQIPFIAILIFISKQFKYFMSQMKPYILFMCLGGMLIIVVVLLIKDWKKNKTIDIYN